MKHPDVFDCAVFATPNQKFGEIPAARIVLTPGISILNESKVKILIKKDCKNSFRTVKSTGLSS